MYLTVEGSPDFSFGLTEIGETRTLQLTLKCNYGGARGDITLTGDAITQNWNTLDTSGVFTITARTRNGLAMTYPQALSVNDRIVYTMTFTPTEEITYTRQFRLASTFSVVGAVYNYYWTTGQGGVAPTLALSVQPLSLIFPDTEIDQESETQDIVISNISESTQFPAIISISALTLADHFSISNLPDLPLEMSPGDSITLHVSFKPTAQGDKSVAQGLRVVSDAPSTPDDVAFVGYCYITAIEPISGYDNSVLFAFAFGAAPTVTVKTADSNDLDCEEPQIMRKAFDFGLPGIDKTITNIYLKTEDLGEAEMSVRVARRMRAADDELTQQRNIDLGSTDEDQLPLVCQADGFTLDGEILHVILYKEASSGPLSLIELIYKYMIMLKFLGTLAVPRISGGVGIVSGSLNGCMAAFYNDTTATFKRFNADDLDCEEDAYVEKTSIFDYEGREKAIMRLWFKAEDMGEVTSLLDITTPRASATQATETIGGDSDQEIINGVFDVIFSGELIKYRITREADAGPLSILSYTASIEPRGELIEE
jgi:hypothetical protein